MTKDEKDKLKEKNNKKYGLSKEYIKYLKIPNACDVKVFEIAKIMNSRKKLTTSEKIEHLLDIKKALQVKLKVLDSGKILEDFNYMSPQEFAESQAEKIGQTKKVEPQVSNS